MALKNLTDSQFEKFTTLIYSTLGVYLNESKRATLDIKLIKIIKKYHPEIGSIDEYYDCLNDPKKYPYIWEKFVDNITVHKTDFFRENDHYEYLKDNIGKILEEIPSIKQKKEIRVWCAAASTGEEPYTTAMVLNEILPSDISIKFLATDISEDVLVKASKGLYKSTSLDDVDEGLKSKYFRHVTGGYEAKDSLKSLITFRKLNLNDPFIFKYKFDIIFCRNVMIYFDEGMKKKVVEKMYDALNDNGIFIIGLSETISDRNTKFALLRASMYKK